MTPAVFSLRRTWSIAANTLREAIRQRVVYFLVLLGLAFLLGAQYFRDLHFGSPELKFIADLGFGAIALFGSVLAVVTTAQLFLGELERQPVLTLLAKPVCRAEFVLGKFAGVAVITGGFCAGLTLVLAAVLWTRESTLMRELPEVFDRGRVVDYRHVAFAGVLQWLKLLVLSALTLLVASYARTQLFAMATGFLIGVACHMQHFAHAASARAGIPVAGLLVCLLPNFQAFDCFQTLGPSAWTVGQVARVAIYASAHVAAACALAVICFQRREL